MKIGKYDYYFHYYHSLYDWALPLRLDVEWYSKDYTEISLQFLCFHVSFIRVSKTWMHETVDNMFKEIENG